MHFNSISFLVFFSAVVTLYFLLPFRFRNFFLLLASCFFYMSYIPIYILILFYTIAVDYFAGIQIEKSDNQKKIWLSLSLFANIGALCFFKYSSFWLRGWNFLDPGSLPPWLANLVLPIGLSFHTFQAMSYTLEVYRGNQRAEKNPLTYALYVMFFPQLVAGPIERPYHLLPQLKEEHFFGSDRAVDGLRLMLWGFFKKMVIADSVAVVVDQVYGKVHHYAGWPLLIATVLFAIQIFCDFSGYSDIAIGAAQVMGFQLMSNFNNPYFSSSFSEFWKRWHISLSSWFRDYFYIPLGGKQVSPLRHYLNLFLTFLVSGAWHGSRMTYVVWGALNGFYLIFGLLTKGLRQRCAQALRLDRSPKFHQILKVGCVFSLTCFAWIFFRADNLSDAFYVVSHLWPGGGESFHSTLANLGWNEGQWLGISGLIFLLLGIQRLAQDQGLRAALSSRPSWLRWGFYYFLVGGIVITFLVSANNNRQFIYFQF